MILALVMAAAETAPHAESAGLPIGAILSVLRMIVVVIFVVAGLFFVLAGTLGVLRLPDFYTRMHAAGITDTLGAELILFGLIVQSGFTQTSAKLGLVAFFLLLTSPTATHAVANAAHQAGLKPLTGRYKAPSLDDILDTAPEDEAH